MSCTRGHGGGRGGGIGFGLRHGRFGNARPRAEVQEIAGREFLSRNRRVEDRDAESFITWLRNQDFGRDGRICLAETLSQAAGSKVRDREHWHRCNRQYGGSETRATRVRLTNQQDDTSMTSGPQRSWGRNVTSLVSWKPNAQSGRYRTVEISGQFEEPFGRVPAVLGHLGEGATARLGDASTNKRHPARLVLAATIGHRSQIRRIGFDHVAIGRA